MRRFPPKDYVDRSTLPTRIELTPMAVVRSPHRERFGTPRQASIPALPQLRDAERARVELLDHMPSSVLTDLEGFEYVWLLSYLHLSQGFSPLVRAPRSPGTKRGVLATRAPHRPNPVGLSAVRITSVQSRCIHVERVDLLDGTPVLDIKPYVPYADAFPDARAGWVDSASEERGTE